MVGSKLASWLTPGWQRLSRMVRSPALALIAWQRLLIQKYAHMVALKSVAAKKSVYARAFIILASH